MAQPQAYYITKNSNEGWDVKKEGEQRASGNFDTKEEAIQRGKEPAKSAPLGQ